MTLVVEGGDDFLEGWVLGVVLFSSNYYFFILLRFIYFLIVSL